MRTAPPFLRKALVAASIAALALPAAAQIKTYQVLMNGANEAPPNASQGLGVAIVTIDMAAETMRLQTTFAALTGNVTMAHIHCCTTTPMTGTASVATMTPTFTGFPSGQTFGSYDHVFDMSLASSYRAGFVNDNGGTAAGAFAALVNGIDAGRAYLNIHTSFVGSGEIRGFLTPVPEPASYALLAAGLAVVGGIARRRRLA